MPNPTAYPTKPERDAAQVKDLREAVSTALRALMARVGRKAAGEFVECELEIIF